MESPDRPGMGRYSTGSMVLHWVIAFALAFELALGFAMPRGVEGFALFQLHKSVGMVILGLTALRLGWRLAHPRPASVEGGLAHATARAVHVGFYLFMVLAPLTGWALVSTASLKVPTVLFGLVPLPHLPLADSINGTAEEAHELLAWLGLALFVLHVVGAVRHEIVLRDRLIGRMAPGGSRPLGTLLALGVIGLGLAAFFAIDDFVRNPVDGPPSQAPQVSVVDASEAIPSAKASPSAAETGTIEAGEEGAPPVWSIRPGGRLAFSVGNGDAGKVEGNFANWRAAIVFDPERPERANIRITVDLASATVGDATQDAMLAGDEYFDSKRFGQAVFTASSVRKTGADRYAAQGTLQLKGIGVPQTVAFRLGGEGLSRKITGMATIDRAAFGIGQGPAAENLSPNVSITFNFDAVGTPGN